jgi:hypothetical protein
LSEEKRTAKARETFFDSVCEYVARNPQLVNSQVAEYFRTLKSKYRIALITTNTKKAIGKILSSAGLEDIFDIIESSKLEEKDDKFAVFDRFVEKHGKPLVYIGGGRKDSFDYCDIMKIKCIFANFEKDDEIPNVESAHDLNELRAMLERA